MCDYSLKHLASRPAKVDDKLEVSRFSGTMSTGFVGPENATMPVCVLPGTELAFEENIATGNTWLISFGRKEYEHKTARFRQVNVEQPHTHHDALELPDGEILLLNNLTIGQRATVLQLPAAPRTEEEAKEQTRLEVVG